ncbi:hypothetical protein K439DRAFT_372360 [Ramaria rubella]|nr:hypothetical protein K439DRAFT_372360 [Ramaria rubella]
MHLSSPLFSRPLNKLLRLQLISNIIHTDRLQALYVLCKYLLAHSTGSWSGIRVELEALSEVFTNPNIVKVFHGAESDIVWLHQNFRLYVVNFFDTYHGTNVLDFPKHPLAALLEMFCGFTPDKRSDTHFALHLRQPT